MGFQREKRFIHHLFVYAKQLVKEQLKTPMSQIKLLCFHGLSIGTLHISMSYHVHVQIEDRTNGRVSTVD